MNVQLLYFDSCPNWRATADDLATLRGEFGFDVELVEVTTPEEAERLEFRGSPSVLVDGRDLFAEPTAPVGLSCRVYQTPDGLAGAPTLDQLRDALARGN